MNDIHDKLDYFPKKQVDITNFNRILKKMSKTEEYPYSRYGFDLPRAVHRYEYTLDDVIRARSNLDIIEMRKISKYFFRNTTSYRRIVDHFAQAYKYYYVVDLKRAAQVKTKNKLLKIYN